MINKILVAIDTTKQHLNVFETAVSLAKGTGAGLMLVHVLSEADPDYPILPTYAYYSLLKGNDDGLFQEQFNQYEHKVTNFLDNLTQKAVIAGIDAEYTLLSGIPGWEICELASTWSADLVLVGSRGLKGLKGMFLGSVSNYVTHHSPCSVLIVRSDSDAVSYSTIMAYQATAEIDSKQEVTSDR
ncbi:MAG: universal stress protein [Cyanobacteria bacterium P01_E01_bin.35]